jgi:hypothetical protein
VPHFSHLLGEVGLAETGRSYVSCLLCNKKAAPALLPLCSSHDILYKTSRDILYTSARAQRAQEQPWLGKRWMFRNNACGLWWRPVGRKNP